jgi:nucleotidyltransferase/DNA polymerase involved in DNA repair
MRILAPDLGGRVVAELKPVAETAETEAELAAVLDLLWRKLHGIHEHEVTRTAARLRQASGQTRAAAEALSITILRAVFTRCSAALFGSDRDDERLLRARMLAELFDLRKERV